MSFAQIIKLLNPDILELLGQLWKFSQQFFPPQGMYEVINYTATLELQDKFGKNALYKKIEQVKFLVDHVIAYQDQAWGDGEILADYQCSPGVVVDRYSEGNRYRVLISLRGTRHRGDTETFHIQRHIKNGFTQKTEYFQTRIDHKTQQITMRIIFPQKRFPKQVVVLEQNRNRILRLQPEHVQKLPDGRTQVSWSMKNPKLFEIYSLKWEW